MISYLFIASLTFWTLTRPPGTSLFHFVRVNRNANLLPTGLPDWKVRHSKHWKMSTALANWMTMKTEVRELEAIEGWRWDSETPLCGQKDLWKVDIWAYLAGQSSLSCAERPKWHSLPLRKGVLTSECATLAFFYGSWMSFFQGQSWLFATDRTEIIESLCPFKVLFIRVSTTELVIYSNTQT